MTRVVQHGLEIIAHGAELLCSDIESVVDQIPIACRTQIYRIAQVLDVQKLVTVVSRPEDRKISFLIGPVVKQFEGTEPLGTDKTFRTKYRRAKALEPKLFTKLFSANLRFSVWTYTLKAVALAYGVVVWNAVDRGRGNVDKT